MVYDNAGSAQGTVYAIYVTGGSVISDNAVYQNGVAVRYEYALNQHTCYVMFQYVVRRLSTFKLPLEPFCSRI